MSTTLDVTGTWLLECFLPSQAKQTHSSAFYVVE